MSHFFGWNVNFWYQLLISNIRDTILLLCSNLWSNIAKIPFLVKTVTLGPDKWCRYYSFILTIVMKMVIIVKYSGTCISNLYSVVFSLLLTGLWLLQATDTSATVFTFRSGILVASLEEWEGTGGVRGEWGGIGNTVRRGLFPYCSSNTLQCYQIWV